MPEKLQDFGVTNCKAEETGMNSDKVFFWVYNGIVIMYHSINYILPIFYTQINQYPWHFEHFTSKNTCCYSPF